jgi:hypothetical protein
MSLFDDLMENLKNEPALPGIVEKITALSMETKLTDAQVDNLRMGLFFFGHGEPEIIEIQKRVFPIIIPAIPHFKMSKKHHDKLLSFILSVALENKDTESQALCVANLPPAFCPGGSLSFYLFVRAFLNGDAEETEKYLYETVVQNLDDGKYKNNDILTFYLQKCELLHGKIEEVKASINRMRPIVIKEKTLAALKKKKYNDAMELLSNAEIPECYTRTSSETCVTVSLPKEHLGKITDEITAQFQEAFRIVFYDQHGSYKYKISYVEKPL